MRRKFLQFMSKALYVPIYFELLPLEKQNFEDCPEITGWPTVFEWGRMQAAMWPRPDRHFRIFVQAD